MTGRLPASRPGVHRLSVRQSSLTGTLSGVPDRRDTSGRRWPKNACGACPAQSTASRTPPHGAGFRGGMNRFAPAVEAPYGTPLNTLMPSTTAPLILPEVVSTTGLLGPAAQAYRRGARTAAPASADPARKPRRLERSIVFMASDSSRVG